MENEELLNILKDHLQRYPQMQPQDVVKLLYQNEFGPGHLISDPLVCLNRLKDEYAYVEPDNDLPDYLEQGCPVVSHSETYRQLYKPAYRVVKKEYIPGKLTVQ